MLFLLTSCIRPHVSVIKMSHSSTSNYHCCYAFRWYCLGDLHIMIWFATGLLWSFWIPQMRRMVALQSRMPSHGSLLPQKVRRCSSRELAFKFLSFFCKKKSVCFQLFKELVFTVNQVFINVRHILAIFIIPAIFIGNLFSQTFKVKYSLKEIK